jgi:hypothetical protein
VGYRELLKKYIRFLELHVHDNFIEEIEPAPEPGLTKRDVAELRTLAGEIFRVAPSEGAPDGDVGRRAPNYNYRLRLLMNRHGLSVAEVASLAGVEDSTLSRWRATPRAPRHLALSRAEFEHFESELYRWLDAGRPPLTARVTAR